MLFYYYRKNVFNDNHPKVFSPVLECSRERPISPTSGSFINKRKSSSGAIFRHWYFRKWYLFAFKF